MNCIPQATALQLSLVLLIVLAGCKQDTADKVPAASEAPPRVTQTEPNEVIKARLGAFCDALGTAVNEDPELFAAWLEVEAPHVTSPLPVVPIDSEGTQIPVSMTVPVDRGWQMVKVEETWWQVKTEIDGLPHSGRTWSSAIPDLPPGSPGKNYYQQLPVEARYLNGIAWALTNLPNPELAGPQCLRDQLGLQVPTQTITHLESALGPIQVYASSTGMVRFDFEHGGHRYYLTSQQSRTNGRGERSTLLFADVDVADPASSRTRLYDVDNTSRWIEVPDGLAGL